MLEAHTHTDFKVLNIASGAFNNLGYIPRKYTCEGDDINPPLEIGSISEEAKSLVLIIEDPDAPSGTGLHWLVWNIPVGHHINENEIPGEEGSNDFGRNTYGGPCPPSGTHRYYFRMYALDDLIDLPAGSQRAEVEAAMRDHIVAYGELVGLYKKVSHHK